MIAGQFGVVWPRWRGPDCNPITFGLRSGCVRVAFGLRSGCALVALWLRYSAACENRGYRPASQFNLRMGRINAQALRVVPPALLPRGLFRKARLERRG